ncbi:MAG: Na+/H+ antiporter subunit E [Desulfobacterales bacterium]|jgi:multicomponent Na+:H+ antiporter subunit E|nr:Na+/H+ antiporter subunit E [Desulfobacteraceae bacterium]MDD3990764.1 Na+/H+ antiporter subunit E [Desulfobacteraceae bacterium]MDY0310545.1 Na+/H+ antiporter subunit E [Desulfobacterales bacterium]
MNDSSQMGTTCASSSSSAKNPARRRRFGLAFWLTFVICMATWMVLSGLFDAFHLSLGVISCAIVADLNARAMWLDVNLGRTLRHWGRFAVYVPWLLIQIWRANLHMLKLTFHPRMRQLINPRMVSFKSRIDNRMGLFIMANSITLTPGTVTVFTSVMGRFTVHAIDDVSARGLPGEMEDRVARIFED